MSKLGMYHFGILHYFLGLEVIMKQGLDEIFISQR